MSHCTVHRVMHEARPHTARSKSYRAILAPYNIFMSIFAATGSSLPISSGFKGGGLAALAALEAARALDEPPSLGSSKSSWGSCGAAAEPSLRARPPALLTSESRELHAMHTPHSQVGPPGPPSSGHGGWSHSSPKTSASASSAGLANHPSGPPSPYSFSAFSAQNGVGTIGYSFGSVPVREA